MQEVREKPVQRYPVSPCVIKSMSTAGFLHLCDYNGIFSNVL